jgi:hypothetical protein
VTEAELKDLVSRCLQEGIPPGVVSRVFDLDQGLVKATQREVNVKRYGTDDMTEYMDYLRRAAVEEALRIIEGGSAADKTRTLGLILGKEMAYSARRTPEWKRDSQNAIIELMENMRGGKAKAEVPKSRFIAQLDTEEGLG